MVPARAFRYLDRFGHNGDEDEKIPKEAADCLVSKESLDDRGELEFTHGNKTLDKLELKNSADESDRKITISISLP